jgi:hypothetical protein
MSPDRLLGAGFLLVAGVTALDELFGSAGLTLRQRLTAAFKATALSAFLFAVTLTLAYSFVTPVVGGAVEMLGYERRRDLDTRQRNALARIVKLDETLVEPSIRDDPEACVDQEKRKAKATKERARVWKRFVKANRVRILPEWITQGEKFVIAGAPLLFFAWAWLSESGSKGTDVGGRRIAATTTTTKEARSPIAMSRGQAMELWLWCWAAAADRDRRFGLGCSTQAVRWQVSACLRIQAAFERFHVDGSSSRRGIRDPLEDRLTRGLDPVGVAFFNRYLVQQQRLWCGRAIAGGDAERAEAETRLKVLEAAASLFRSIVRATSEEIERGAASLPMATDDRRLQTGLRMGGVVIYDERTEGPIPSEEERQRWAEASRRLGAGKKELKS